MSLPQSFTNRKKLILSKLAVPTDEYNDLSPKGSVDEAIRELIDEINSLEGCVTTSSCAGRVSVFLEGKKSFDDEEAESREQHGLGMGYAPDVRAEKTAGVGGKGGGGRWLYVSHDAIDSDALFKREAEGSLCKLLGMSINDGDDASILAGSKQRYPRHIHFKFEPMVCHIHPCYQ